MKIFHIYRISHILNFCVQNALIMLQDEISQMHADPMKFNFMLITIKIKCTSPPI